MNLGGKAMFYKLVVRLAPIIETAANDGYRKPVFKGQVNFLYQPGIGCEVMGG